MRAYNSLCGKQDSIINA